MYISLRKDSLQSDPRTPPTRMTRTAVWPGSAARTSWPRYVNGPTPVSANYPDGYVRTSSPSYDAETRSFLPLYPGQGQGTALLQDPRPMGKKMCWPPIPPRSYARLSSAKMSQRYPLPSQPTMRAVLLHRTDPALFPRPKLPLRPPPPKVLHQQPSEAENKIQTVHDQRLVLAWNINITPIATVPSRQQPVLVQQMLNWSTLG